MQEVAAVKFWELVTLQTPRIARKDNAKFEPCSPCTTTSCTGHARQDRGPKGRVTETRLLHACHPQAQHKMCAKHKEATPCGCETKNITVLRVWGRLIVFMGLGACSWHCPRQPWSPCAGHCRCQRLWRSACCWWLLPGSARTQHSCHNLPSTDGTVWRLATSNRSKTATTVKIKSQICIQGDTAGILQSCASCAEIQWLASGRRNCIQKACQSFDTQGSAWVGTESRRCLLPCERTSYTSDVHPSKELPRGLDALRSLGGRVQRWPGQW